MTTVRLLGVPPGSGERSEWMRLVHKVNEIEPGLFGRPDSTGPWWAGGSVEEYPDARIIHRDDRTVSITAKTDRGAAAIRLAAAALAVRVTDPPDADFETGAARDEEPLDRDLWAERDDRAEWAGDEHAQDVANGDVR